MEGICTACNKPLGVVPLGPNNLCHYHERKVGKAVKALGPVNSKSEKQTQKEKLLAVITAANKAKYPFCQAKLIGCTGKTEHSHHIRGKVGKDYLDPDNLLAVCAACHRQIEDSPSKAKALGLSVSRLSKETENTTEES